jgi:cytochrome d ubiquinol oxidase subunit II
MSFDWLSPFSVLTAVAVVGGYMMFGSTYIIMKTQGKVARSARHTAGWGAGIVPPALTVYQTAAQPLTLRSMLIAVGVALPILLAYNILQYWIFRGKTTHSTYGED